MFVKIKKKGIGRLLTARAKEHAIENGYAKIELESASTNQIAQALYFSQGYINQEKNL